MSRVKLAIFHHMSTYRILLAVNILGRFWRAFGLEIIEAQPLSNIQQQQLKESIIFLSSEMIYDAMKLSS